MPMCFFVHSSNCRKLYQRISGTFCSYYVFRSVASVTIKSFTSVPSRVRERRSILSRLQHCSINANSIGDKRSLAVQEAPRWKIVERMGWSSVDSSVFVFDVSADLFGLNLPPVKCPRQQAASLYVKHELIFQQLYLLTYEMGRYIDGLFQRACTVSAISTCRLENLSLHYVQVLKTTAMIQRKENYYINNDASLRGLPANSLHTVT